MRGNYESTNRRNFLADIEQKPKRSVGGQPKETIVVRIEKDMHDKLKNFDAPVTHVIRAALELYLIQLEGKVKLKVNVD